MFRILPFKTFYSPEGNGGIGDVDPVETGPTDRDILNSEDTDGVSDEEKPIRKHGKGKVSSEGESEEGEVSDEEEGEDEEDSESEESDGTGDEDVEDDEDSEEDVEDEDEEDEIKDLASSNLSKAVKRAAPDLFKKVPGLREALEEHKQFAEVFTNPDEAKSAAHSAKMLNAVYQDIASGDVKRTGDFLKAIKTVDEGAFEDFSHTILDSIGELSPQLYGEVMLKPMKKALMSMYADALKSNNKNLAAVAIHAHNYWFETQDIKAPLEERKKISKTKEQEAFEKEKSEFESSKLGDFKTGITEVVNHSMKLSITKELDGLKMDDYQKRNVIRDIFTEIDSVLGSDKRYLSGIQSLFDQAKSSKYSPDWKSRVVKAYLQRARQALPAVRNKVLKEAGIKFKEPQKSESRRLIPAGLGGGKSEDRIDFSRVDRSRTTDMDILNGRPKYIK
jgi:hypothetical protein